VYLRTPKRYTARNNKGSRRPLISLRWLWLYLLAPIVIVIGAMSWNFRVPISQQVSTSIARIKLPNFNAPTPTPTLPAADLLSRIQNGLQNGDISSALDAMRSYNEANPNDSKWHALYARILALHSYTNDADTIKTAISAGQAAINANPEIADGWASEALALDWSNQSKLALIYALRAKDFNDPTGFTDAVLAGIYNSLGNSDQADKLADSALSVNPDIAYAYFVKGQVAAQTGDPKGAIDLYRKGWSLSKADPLQSGSVIADSLAALYGLQKQSDTAQTLLIEAEQHDKDDPGLRLRESSILYSAGQQNKAIEAAQQCLDHAPKFAPCYVTLTVLYYVVNKEYEKATQSAQSAIQYGTTDTKAYYYGGYAYYKLNQCAEAIPLFQSGMALAQKAANADVVSNFNDALNVCGVTSGIVASTATPSGSITPTLLPPSPTATAHK
jgi:lipoprotein NlpI